MQLRAVLLVMMLAVAACGTSEPRSAADGSRSAPAPAPSPATADVSPEPSGDAPFGAVDAVGGGQIDGAELAGRDLALWFWAPW
jgi:hypothetical protein